MLKTSDETVRASTSKWRLAIALVLSVCALGVTLASAKWLPQEKASFVEQSFTIGHRDFTVKVGAATEAEASANCAADQGVLAALDTEAARDAVYGLSGYGHFWVGATRDGNGGFSWDRGVAFDIAGANLIRNNPDQSCAAFYANGAGPLNGIESMDCSTTLDGFVCEHAPALIYSPWSGYVNSWDSAHSTYAYVDGKRAAFCGVDSYHDNGKEDRQFKFRYCTGSNYPTLSAQSDLGWTTYDAAWTKSCPAGKVIGYWQSQHDNGKEDRQFRFMCYSMAGTALSGCSYTGYYNGWDASFSYTCPAGKVLAGVGSQHDNGKEDRQFKFRCCSVQF